MKVKNGLILMAFLATIAGCTGYNSTRVKDKNKDNTVVYGDINGPARQLANKYDADPNSLDRATKLREKMFGEGVTSE